MSTYQELQQKYQRMFGMRGQLAQPHLGGRVIPSNPEADLDRVSRENAMAELGRSTGSGAYGDALGKIFGTNPEIGAALFQGLYGQEAAQDEAARARGMQEQQMALQALLGMEGIKSKDFGSFMGSKVAAVGANAELAGAKRDAEWSKFLAGEQGKNARSEARIKGEYDAAAVKMKTAEEMQKERLEAIQAQKEAEQEQKNQLAFTSRLSEWANKGQQRKEFRGFKDMLIKDLSNPQNYVGFPVDQLDDETVRKIQREAKRREIWAEISGNAQPRYDTEMGIAQHAPHLSKFLKPAGIPGDTSETSSPSFLERLTQPKPGVGTWEDMPEYPRW
ncbi:MAG: hypothetical protein ABFD97_23715 [Syntrophobacter sp.]